MRDKHEQNLLRIENVSSLKQGLNAAKSAKPGSLVEASELARKAFNRTQIPPKLDDFKEEHAISMKRQLLSPSLASRNLVN